MEIVQLQSFVVVAEERSFTRGAERMFVATSALSRRIKELESELGSPLFVRGYHSVELTALGDSLLPLARRLVEDVEDFVTLARKATTPPERTLAIGFPPLLHPEALHCLLDIVVKYVPLARVRLKPYPNAELGDRLLQRNVELALLHEHLSTAELDTVPILTERLGVVVPSAHIPDGRRSVALRDLVGLTYVTSENGSAPGFYKHIDSLLDDAGIVDRLELPRHELATTVNLVSSGTSFALCALNERSPGRRIFAGEPVTVMALHDVNLWISTSVGWNIREAAADDDLGEVISEVQRRLPAPQVI